MKFLLIKSQIYIKKRKKKKKKKANQTRTRKIESDIEKSQKKGGKLGKKSR